MNIKKKLFCPICFKRKYKLEFQYDCKPEIEVDFGIPKKNYNRAYFSCDNCLHWFSNVEINLKKFYSSDYVSRTYNINFFNKFKKIIDLPKKKSDNYFRVRRIKNFLYEKNIKNPKILDVGSGLGVFPYFMKKNGFNIYALDPDILMQTHLKKKLKIKTIFKNFLKIKEKNFDLITFNKVLEHVENPSQFLKKSKNILRNQSNSFLYIELPDINIARKISKNREEFTIEHIHGFTESSIFKLLDLSGYEVLKFERILEPSNKLTFYVFCRSK
jgi:ubiquinone/menaquinone biosynthesis C-methylase UbiE